MRAAASAVKARKWSDLRCDSQGGRSSNRVEAALRDDPPPCAARARIGFPGLEADSAQAVTSVASRAAR